MSTQKNAMEIYNLILTSGQDGITSNALKARVSIKDTDVIIAISKLIDANLIIVDRAKITGNDGKPLHVKLFKAKARA